MKPVVFPTTKEAARVAFELGGRVIEISMSGGLQGNLVTSPFDSRLLLDANRDPWMAVASRTRIELVPFSETVNQTPEP